MLVAEEDYLSHHGVKGQKWGVRRAEKKRAKWTRTPKQVKMDRHRHQAVTAIGLGTAYLIGSKTLLDTKAVVALAGGAAWGSNRIIKKHQNTKYAEIAG